MAATQRLGLGGHDEESEEAIESRLGRTVIRYSHGSRVPGWDDAVDLTKPPATVPDPAHIDVPDTLRREVEAAMAKYPDIHSAAIPALHAAQKEHGYCSPEAIEQVASVMRLTPAYLTSVASFYDMFALAPKPKHDVFVCTNISCSLLGADAIHERMIEVAGDHPDLNVASFECLGACDIGPMASVNGEYVGPLELADCERIADDLENDRPVLRDKQLRYRPCADPNADPDRSTGGSRSEPPIGSPPGDSDDPDSDAAP